MLGMMASIDAAKVAADLALVLALVLAVDHLSRHPKPPKPAH